MNVTIANLSTTIDDAVFAKAIAAIGSQVSRDFQPIWNVAATITGTKLALHGSPAAINSPGDAIIYLGDTSADPTTGVDNAFGYHSANYSHIPYGFVYLNVCQQYGEEWSCTVSHEVLELLADPTAVLTISGPAPNGMSGNVDYDLEVCDPTQGDAYVIDGVSVSNFVTRVYFGMAAASNATNFLNLTLSPFGARPNGYIQYEANGGAHQVDGEKVDTRRLAARAILGVYRRNARRASRLIG